MGSLGRDHATPPRAPVRVAHGGHEPSFGRPRLIKIADAYLDRHDA